MSDKDNFNNQNGNELKLRINELEQQVRNLQHLNKKDIKPFKFEQMLSRLSAKFVNLPPNQIDEEVNAWLKRIANFLDLDMTALIQFSGDGNEFIVTHSYGYKWETEITGMDVNLTLPWYSAKLKGDEAVVFNNTDQLPDDAREERQFCLNQEMKSHISLPLKVGSIIVGGIAFSSCSERIWQDELIRQLRLLAEIFGNALHRKQVQGKLEALLRFEQMISKLSAVFVDLPAKEVDGTIKQGLQSIGRFLNVDRCSLYLYSNQQSDFRISHTWAEKGADPAPDVLTSQMLPWINEKWKRGEIVDIHNVANLPAEATIDRQSLIQMGVKSHLSLPLTAGESMLGALAMVALHRHRIWPREYIQRIKILGRIFANALMRRKAELDLLNAFSEIKKLKNQIEADYTYLREEIKLEHNFEEIIGQSDPLKYVLFKVEQVAPTDSIVLIQGETGTGKELFARAIHNASLRNDRPLVKINCATLPANLIESELFGYEKGAFSGANIKQIGRFGLSDGGTIFLDEIGELPLELQPKLLRVVQEGEFERLGNPRTVKVDVRIIAATNRNLEEEVNKQRFRKDLWFRLNVFPITIPPLRHRRDDIPLLVEWFVNMFAKKLGRIIKTIPQASMRELTQYSWPGNIRELRNVIERAVLNTVGPTLHLTDRLGIKGNLAPADAAWKTLTQLEREYIIQVLEEFGWIIEGKHGAAQALDINPGTLRSRMKKHGITRPGKHAG
jgi:transcriptional regulator with GAF, ATPase, and Fis domain